MQKVKEEFGLYVNLGAGYKPESSTEVALFGRKHGMRVTACTVMDDIVPAVKRYSPGMEYLFVFGGDGTLFWVLDCILHERQLDNLPKFIALGGGTMNRMTTLRAKWRSDALHNIKIAFSALEDGSLDFLPLTLLQVKWGSHSHYCATFIGGAPIKLMERYYRSITTPATAAKFLIQGISAGIVGWPRDFTDFYHHVKAKIIVDGRELSRQSFLIMIKDAYPQLVFGVKPYKGDCQPGQSFSLAYAVDYSTISWKFIPYSRGWLIPNNDDRFFNQPSREMIIEPQMVLPITLDGELFEVQAGEKITITTGPTIRVAKNPFANNLTRYLMSNLVNVAEREARRRLRHIISMEK